MTDVITPALFDLLDDYVSLLDGGEAIVDDVVPATSPLIVFTENAFVQFFENEVKVKIEGFNETSQRQATRARIGKTGLKPEAKRIITLFQQFCEEYDDVKSASYGGQGKVLEEFHTRLVERLVERIRDLAVKNEEEELEERAAGSLEYLAEIVAIYDWPQHNREDREDE